MRLLLDEMLSSVIAQQLRERGHDVQAINASEYEGLSDVDVLSLARSQRRALVTNNVVDFRPLCREAIEPGGHGHLGVVFMPSSYRRGKADVGRMIPALEEKLREFPGESDLANGESWL